MSDISELHTKAIESFKEFNRFLSELIFNIETQKEKIKRLEKRIHELENMDYRIIEDRHLHPGILSPD